MATMDTSKLKPNDPRVAWKSANIRGKTYTYILGEPMNGSEPIETILLNHGFPDMAFGWRYQIPFLMGLGFRVICPNMLGYAGTDAPEDLEQFSHKNMADDMKELVRQIIGEGKQIILGGHDWGGAQVFRTFLWHPELVKAVFSVCTPYAPPNRMTISLEDLVKTRMPQFAYQLQFRGPEVQEKMQGAENIRQTMCGMWEGRGPNGEKIFDAMKGINFDNMPLMGKSPIMSDEEMEFYVSEYMKQPAPQMRGPLNWYRTRDLNGRDEKALVEEKGDAVGRIDIPVLYISASQDQALPPALSLGMEKCIPNLSRGEVNSSHWALVRKADEVNSLVKDWLSEVTQGKVKSSL